MSQRPAKTRSPYRLRRSLMWACLLTIVLAHLGCSDTATRPEASSPSSEARLIALFASGELQPPYSLAYEVQNHLAAIREAYRGTCPFVDSVSFRPNVEPSFVLLGLDDSAVVAVRDDRYHAWDSLNAQLGILRINKDSLVRYRRVSLYFRDLLHPRRLAALYAHLPGVRYAEPGESGGDGSNVYPRLRGSYPTYLFRKGSGDCPMGCTSNYYWYFSILPAGPHFVGAWDGIDPPPWWDDAKLNVEEYRTWMQWP